MLHPTLINPDSIDAKSVLPFNHRWIDDKVMISHEFGGFAFLNPDEFTELIEGKVAPGHARYQELADKGFLAAHVEDRDLIESYRARKSFLNYGPTLHAFVLTERCNHGCQYCHSSVVSMKRTDTDMTIEIAERSVDFAFQTTSPWLSIEFQGGEPMANWDTLKHVVEYASRKNRLARKELSFALVTNLTLMDDEKLDFLIENRVQICTSLDGPEDLHNKIRIYNEGNAHEQVVHWIEKINRRYVELGLDPQLYRIEALPTITRDSLSRGKEIVDEYVRVGNRAIFLRVLDPFGFAEATRKVLGYSIDDFLKFYRDSVDYIIELNKEGVQVMERLAAIMLNKMLTGTDPNYLDLRSPGGAVVGQMAYHPDGRIYSSDEGRMVAAMGDDIFCVGNVQDTGYNHVVANPQTRALLLAAISDGHPHCMNCVYKPYCGQQPEYNYKTQGSIFGRMVDSTWCTKHMGIFDYLAEKLKNADAEEMAIFDRWTTNRRQDHFIHSGE